MKNIKLVDLFIKFVQALYVWFGGVVIQHYSETTWSFWDWSLYVTTLLTALVITVVVVIILAFKFIEKKDFGDYPYSS